MTLARYQAVASRLERRALEVRCLADGTPTDAAARARISRKYRRALNVIMRAARERARS